MDREAVFKKIRAVGRAALAVDLENSHSGNISMKLVDESGREVLAITATGSQKGELTPDKICFPTLRETNYGHFKASSETDIHARILAIPGVNGTVHGHTKYATVVTFDDAPMPKQNPRTPLKPIDALAARYLGDIPVDWFEVASGSKEMTDLIGIRLEQGPACMVQAHGVFARGASLDEAFFNLCLSEHAGQIIYFAELLGSDLEGLRDKIARKRESLRKYYPDYDASLNTRVDFADEPDTVEMFLTQGRRSFESRYSPFHAGSMSIRGSRTMLYAARAAMPEGLPGPLLELPLQAGGEDAGLGAEVETHRAIYHETPLKAVVHHYPAEVEAVALVVDAARGGEMPKIIPIDAEGGFLYPSVPVLPADPDQNILCRAILDYRMAAVAHGGVWAAGEQSVGEALRHVSSIKDICFYRIMARARRLNLSCMEPPRAHSW